MVGAFLTTTTTTIANGNYPSVLRNSDSSLLPRQHNYWRRFGISEWRDKLFDFPGAGNDRRLGTESTGPPKEVCILPFPYDEVLLQGETKQLRLYEDRFLKLFDHCMEHHEGVVAMGLLADTGIIQTVPLCEIEAFNRMEGFGIFVTIRVVGRAQLFEISQQTPYIRAVCRELNDKIPPNLELPNLLASNIENYLLLLSNMEAQLAKTPANETELEDTEEVAEMKRRIQVAKLDDRFYDDLGEEEDEVTQLDRRGRFKQAYNVALATDTQGYCLSQGGTSYDRSPQELTAISWAAFCTSTIPEEDAATRIQALDCEDLFERLKLASHTLKEKKKRLKKAMEKAGIRFEGEEFDEDF
ncbi:hypothetical protein IV203_025929 [Nitzschia inconspicua]|uniref:Uncharacterized protein n=1 Tax=Nitzschia inconspicua TaxID=303405 RepID=A0A9K3K6F4_9STRA|nr:hypothetical protein IV203_017758 [Nitzschia inconspicua]KAG7362263.1 hypothetical protein IV203_025929 [Nitzschia inconspicua]